MPNIYRWSYTIQFSVKELREEEKKRDKRVNGLLYETPNIKGVSTKASARNARGIVREQISILERGLATDFIFQTNCLRILHDALVASLPAAGVVVCWRRKFLNRQ